MREKMRKLLDRPHGTVMWSETRGAVIAWDCTDLVEDWDARKNFMFLGAQKPPPHWPFDEHPIKEVLPELSGMGLYGLFIMDGGPDYKAERITRLATREEAIELRRQFPDPRLAFIIPSNPDAKPFDRICAACGKRCGAHYTENCNPGYNTSPIFVDSGILSTDPAWLIATVTGSIGASKMSPVGTAKPVAAPAPGSVSTLDAWWDNL